MISQRAELPIVAFSVRVYQALLVAYPTKFQQKYGSQMVQVFQDCCLRALRQGGTNGMARLWAVTLLDLVQSVISEHRQKEIEMKREMKPEDIQMAGGALIWGAVAFVIGTLSLIMGGPPLWGVSVILTTILSMPLLVVGLLGVRSRYGQKVGGFGKNILLVGVILGPLTSLIGLFGLSYSSGLLGVLLSIGPTVLFACLALFGFVALYKRPLPRWNVAPVMAGVWSTIHTLLYITTSMSTGDWEGGGLGIPKVVLIILFIIQGIALAALGYILKSDAPEETAARA
jgi:hypothetical protein